MLRNNKIAITLNFRHEDKQGRRLVLLRRANARDYWWGHAGSREAALFDSEAEARSWILRTFRLDVDREGYATMQVAAIKAEDARCAARRTAA